MNRELNPARVRTFLAAAALRMVEAAGQFGEDLPDYYDVAAGRWFMNGGWTEGFWPGVLWRLYSHSKDKRLADHARLATRLVARRHAKTDDHDLGFLFLLSCVREHETTGSDEMLPAAAAERLAARFLPDGRYIPAHAPVGGAQAGFAIIDTVMNLPLLDRCLLAGTADAVQQRGLLGLGCRSLRKNQGLISEIVVGDYYLAEAWQRWMLSLTR